MILSSCKRSKLVQREKSGIREATNCLSHNHHEVLPPVQSEDFEDSQNQDSLNEEEPDDGIEKEATTRRC